MATKKSSTKTGPVHSEGERLQKVLAQAGIGSRRACELLIEQGYVEVNGEPVTALPVFVNPGRDRIVVNGKVVRKGERQLYVMLYKPRRTVTTLADDAGRRTVAELVKHPSGTRLYPVGRLDYDTLGLVLMTNDGDLTNQLTHPRFGVEKTYRADLKGFLSDQDIARLERSGSAASRRSNSAGSHAASISIVKRDETRTVIDVTLREGRNQEVRHLLARIGCPVKKLVRTQLGPLKLKGLQMGEWRELTPGEIRAIRRFGNDAEAGNPRSAAGKPQTSRTRPKRPKLKS